MQIDKPIPTETKPSLSRSDTWSRSQVLAEVIAENERLKLRASMADSKILELGDRLERYRGFFEAHSSTVRRSVGAMSRNLDRLQAAGKNMDVDGAERRLLAAVLTSMDLLGVSPSSRPAPCDQLPGRQHSRAT